MKYINVIITSTGGIVAQGIIKSLKYHNRYAINKKYKYRIFGTDINFEAAGLYRSNSFTIIEKPRDKNYIKSIIELCKKYKIHVLFAGSDIELPVLCNSKELIEQKTNAKVITSQRSIVEMCRDKYQTYNFLRENNLNFIPTSSIEDLDDFLKEEKFPLVVKPREGFGSKLFQIVNDMEELTFAANSISRIGWKPVVQKYLKNDTNEFTTGLTMDKEGKKIMSTISLKKILKHGQTYKAFIDKYPKINAICERIALRIGANGPLNIQTRIDEDDKKVKIIEINPRFSASGPMRTVAGINEPDIIVRNVLFDEKEKTTEHKSLVCLRYWNESYLDLNKFKAIKLKRDRLKKLESTLIDYF